MSNELISCSLLHLFSFPSYVGYKKIGGSNTFATDSTSNAVSYYILVTFFFAICVSYNTCAFKYGGSRAGVSSFQYCQHKYLGTKS